MITLNTSTPFTSRKREIRLADDISRKANNAFPMLSQTKYQVFGSDYSHRGIRDISNRAIQKLLKDIFVQRKQMIEEINKISSSYSGPFLGGYVSALKKIKEAKKGNCGEYAIAVLGLLYANGYSNSTRADLKSKITYKDKVTGKIIDEFRDNLDHGVVITSMKKGDKTDENKCNIVIDSWANITDTKQNAISKYRIMFKDQINKAEEEGFETLERHYRCGDPAFDYKRKFNRNDFEVKSKLYFKTIEKLNDDEIRQLADHFIQEFGTLN